MKVISMSAVLSAALLSATAWAQPDAQALVVPGTMTDAGHQFVGRCSDSAFARHQDPAALAKHCDRLLARWKQQADKRVARRANPRVESVLTVASTEQANLPYDTTASFRQAPLLYSYGGL